jgi:coenzyme PQQ precursor peptide PqqA
MGADADFERRSSMIEASLERRSPGLRANLEALTNVFRTPFERSSAAGIVDASSTPIDEEAVMKWTKPAFKTLELASEVTAYRYTR